MNSYGLMTLLFVLGAVGCQNKLKVKTMTSGAKLIYEPGMPVVVADSDTGTPPLFLGDTASICSDLTFYDADGELVHGARDCNGSKLADPNLKPEYIMSGVTILGVTGTAGADGPGPSLLPQNIRSGVTISGVTGSLIPAPADCASDGALGCVSNVNFPAAAIAGISGKIAAGQTVAGVGGSYVASSYSSCATDGEMGCVTTASFKAAQIAGLAAKVLSGQTVAATAGSATAEAHSDCTAANQTGCVATSSYKTMDLSGLLVGTGLTASNFDTTIASAGSFYFWDATGARHSVSGDTDLTAGNILSGKTIFGINGTVTASPANCSSNGSQSCVATGSYFAATSCAADASNCYLPAYVASTQPLKAISYDAINAGKASIRTALTLSGIAGTLSDCVANDVAGCVTTASYKSADWTNLTAANIKNGVVVAGLTGTYPSSGNTLTGADATADLDSATFNAKLKSATAFEWFGPDGSRYTGAGDADILDTNIASGVTIFGTTGTLSGGGGSICTAVTQGACITDTACRWTGSACEVNPWNIRTGVSLSGKTGKVKTSCRNFANGTWYNSNTMPPGNAATAVIGSIDWWDTLDSYNNNVDALPTAAPSGWTTNNYCGKELWSDVTPDGACDSAADDCMMVDNITGLIWSEGYPVASTASADTTLDWSASVAACDGLTYGGRSDWRLPTQMELMQAYEHGIRDVGYKGGGTIRPSGDTTDNNDSFIIDVDRAFWSATTTSYNQQNAWYVNINYGRVYNDLKTVAYRLICVAP